MNMDKAMEALKPIDEYDWIPLSKCSHCGDFKHEAASQCRVSSGHDFEFIGKRAFVLTGDEMTSLHAAATSATPEPVAPTPSPDIAGLVDKYVHMSAATANERLVYDDGFLSPKMLEPFMEDVRALATALQRVAQERDTFRRRLYDHVDHSIAAEARLSSARDEGLEMAAKVADANAVGNGDEYDDADIGAVVSAKTIAAAIRALKGTKP